MIYRVGNDVTGTMHARLNMLPAESAGKHVTVRKRGKTCNCWKARENMLPVSAPNQCAGCPVGSVKIPSPAR